MSTIAVSESRPASAQTIGQNQRMVSEIEAQYIETTIRWGAYTTLGGAISYIIGAALWIASGVDIDQALASDEMSSYLVAAGSVGPLIIANLTFWVLGALLLSASGTALVSLCLRRRAIAQLALPCYRTGISLAIVAYLAWLALQVQVVPDNSAGAVLLAETIGWFASRADWLATVLMIGVGPVLISLAGRGDWVPLWLARLSIATAVTALLTTIAMFTDALTSYGFLIIPVGLAWLIGAGIVLLRRLGSLSREPKLSPLPGD